jgi:ABC-type multidrug transport system fused ATPase/permease subunit
VALVGTTGSGKSTIANLLLRFVAPENGRILLHNAAHYHTDLRGGRRRLAGHHRLGAAAGLPVQHERGRQHPSGPRGASDAEIRSGGRRRPTPTLHPAVAPGVRHLVGENGTRLSGGQAQRLALARALIRRPDLYIFDEATANLDSDNERIILENLRRR